MILAIQWTVSFALSLSLFLYQAVEEAYVPVIKLEFEGVEVSIYMYYIYIILYKYMYINVYVISV